MKAEANSWKRKPFTDGISIPLSLEIHKGQIDRVSKGLIPKDMEDKWFIYFDTPYLFIHRSWTGQAVYRLAFTKSPKGYTVSEALLSSDLLKTEEGELQYQGELALFLVCNFLLGQKRPFPSKLDIEEPLVGTYQHHISGTAYSEK